jgi:hypothetical protein
MSSHFFDICYLVGLVEYRNLLKMAFAPAAVEDSRIAVGVRDKFQLEKHGIDSPPLKSDRFLYIVWWGSVAPPELSPDSGL